MNKTSILTLQSFRARASVAALFRILFGAFDSFDSFVYFFYLDSLSVKRWTIKVVYLCWACLFRECVG